MELSFKSVEIGLNMAVLQPSLEVSDTKFQVPLSGRNSSEV